MHSNCFSLYELVSSYLFKFCYTSPIWIVKLIVLFERAVITLSAFFHFTLRMFCIFLFPSLVQSAFLLQKLPLMVCCARKIDHLLAKFRSDLLRVLVVNKSSHWSLIFALFWPLIFRYLANHPELEPERRTNCEKQMELLRRICDEYEKEESDDAELMRNRFETISTLMVELQSYGYPSEELVGSAPPGWSVDRISGFLAIDDVSKTAESCSIVWK